MNFIISVLVKPAIILCFALFLSLVWRRASASTRCAIWALSLFSALILPIAEVVLPEFDLPLMSANQTSMAVMPPAIPLPDPAGENTLDSLGETHADNVWVGGVESPTPLPLTRATAILTLTWLMGFTVVLGRLLFGVRAAQRLTKQSTIQDEDSKQLLVELPNRNYP